MAQVVSYEQFLASDGSLDARDPRWSRDQISGGPWHCTGSNLVACAYLSSWEDTIPVYFQSLAGISYIDPARFCGDGSHVCIYLEINPISNSTQPVQYSFSISTDIQLGLEEYGPFESVKLFGLMFQVCRMDLINCVI